MRDSVRLRGRESDGKRESGRDVREGAKVGERDGERVQTALLMWILINCGR